MTRLLLRGGYVHTPADPHATAIAVEGGQVVWTGDDDAADHFADNATRVVELEGRLVVPAFVDAHAHLGATGLAARAVDLSATRTLIEALDKLAAAEGPFVMGHGWNETEWAEHRLPTLAEVDRAVAGRPAYISRIELHSALVSSALLARAADIARADGYADGRVERDAHHLARNAFFALMPGTVREEALHQALETAASLGIGMVHELGAPHLCPETDLATIRGLAGVLPEVIGYWGELGADGVKRAEALGCAGAAGDLCVDGAIGARTAALHAPYSDDPQRTGHLYLTAEQVADHLAACTDAGLQGGFHVIGDRGVDEVAAGFRLAAERLGAPALVMGRHRLEHLEMTSSEAMATFGELGVTASMQPMFDGWWGGSEGFYAERLGDRARGMNPLASLNRAGMALALGSDSPVTPLDPWGAVRAAAWHHDESERITVRAAFNAHTRGGWRAARLDEGGVIAIGAPASIAVFDVPGDLVVQTPDDRVAAWSTDLRAGVPQLPGLHPDEDLPTCALTLVRGQVAYDREGVLQE
ncbi:MAG TPA: amidohydrolase family protein [Nocardioidaceae bacterium]|nr:amidohydrolase family protein [Nocardioidaceae bacterium]